MFCFLQAAGRPPVTRVHRTACIAAALGGTKTYFWSPFLAFGFFGVFTFFGFFVFAVGAAGGVVWAKVMGTMAAANAIASTSFFIFLISRGLPGPLTNPSCGTWPEISIAPAGY